MRRRKATRKTAILIRCTVEEAQTIRRAAGLERRTISGYILNAVMRRFGVRPLPASSFLARP